MKNTSNRKKSNKITAYVPDDLRDFLASESAKPGNSRSKVIQKALALLKDSGQ